MNRLSRVFVPVGALALLFSEILLIAACFLVAAYLILPVDPTVFLFYDNGLLRIALAGGSILFGLYFEDLYAKLYVTSRVLLIQQLSLVMGIALLAQGILGYVSDGLRLPLRLMLPTCAVLVLALFAWRVVYSVFVLRVVGPRRILLVGMSPLVAEMCGHIGAHPELGLQVIGYVDDGEARAAPPEGGAWLGPVSALQRIAAETAPDRIVVGLDERRGQTPIADLLQLRYGGLAIDEASAAYELLCGRVLLGELHPSEMLMSGSFRPRPQRLVYQTLGDWLLALILTVLSAPLLLLAAVLLKLSSQGPLLIREECMGLGCKPFRLCSFRLADDGRNGAQRFVARWRLDALPRLWNVLRGDMSFVGPRADRTEFAKVLSERIPFYRQRYVVKPGITGWAQINTAPDQPEDTLRSLEYDFYYLKHLSGGLDTYIMVHTLRDLLLAPPPAAFPANVPAWHTNS
ncbi:MAG TPA: sugar transferase [Bryobacteraceae bacterium]|jgi:lipopolysaccharide/colanic/teichoic acid biosynthesis glycosyltransferase|nr:sugar transferase [Bryobacteraceae bacterium]